MEVWKDVVGSHGMYEVSSCGRVRNKSTGAMKKTYLKGKSVCVSLEGYDPRRTTVSKLMGESFMHTRKRVFHINGDPSDNRLENLEVRSYE